MKKFLLRLAVILFVAASTAAAQRYLGSVQGEINDPSGAKVPGATVTVEEGTTHYKLSTVANGVGSYNFPQLNPGTYTVTVNAPGFKATAKTGVILTAGQLQQVDFDLVTGAASEVVEVRTDTNPLIDTGSPNIAMTISKQEATDLPNVGRNPYVMATLAPGVIYNGYFTAKSSQFTNPFSGVSVQISAEGNGGHNRLTLNGIPNDPAERFSGANYMGFTPSPEAVEEVKIQTSIYDAQVGHGNGAVTNTVVRGGNNHLHGAAYYVFQNTYLNANTSEKAGLRQARNNDQLSQTGFVLDGPVYLPKIYNGRDKTYFMVAFERYASHTAINYQSRVPTVAERAGDFSALCSAFDSTGLCTSGVQLYVPTSPVDGAGNRTQYYANNNIAGAINSVGAAYMTYLPTPNVSGAGITANNYVSTQTSYPSTYPSFIARFDQKIGNGTLSALFFRSGLTQNYPMQGFPKGIGPTGYGYNVYRNNRGGSLDYVHTFSPSMVLDSRLGLIYHPFGLAYPGNQGFNLGGLGITGTNLPYQSFPGTSMSDSYAGLASGAGGQVSENTFGSLEEVLTKTFRHHTVRFGFEGNLIRYNVQNPQSGFGTFNFDRFFTRKNINTADSTSGDPAAAMLLGAFTSVSYNITPAYALQQIYMAPFIQDDWRVTDKLTVNLGVRWDYESPFTERYNKQASNFCTTCTNPLQASVTGLTLNGGLQYTSANNRYPYPKDLNNWQPRLGAAYQVHPGTVVRAGFGIIYFNTLETPIGTGFSQTTSYTNYVTATPVNTIANPFPSGVVLPTGSSLGLSTALGQNISFIDPNHVQPKSAQYSASIQQQFPGNWSFQIAYVGALPTRLEVNHDINVLPSQYYSTATDYATQNANVTYLNTAVANPMAGKIPLSTTLNAATVPRRLLLLPFPEFGSVTEQYSSIGSAPYNSLQVQIQKPMRNRYSMQANFTWQKTMLHNGFFATGPGGTQDNASVASGKLYSIQDATATLAANIVGTYMLPTLAGHAYIERVLLGGWQTNAVIRFQNGSLISTPGNVDVIGDPHQGNWNYARMINTCYQNPQGVNVNTTASAPACDNLSPNPAYRQRLSYTVQRNSSVLQDRIHLKPLADLSVFKKFVIRESVNFEIRGEFFNVLNSAIFGGPSTSVGGSTFGAAGYTASGGVNYYTQTNDARIGQLTARINF